MHPTPRFDMAVVGAGIVGLGHAAAAVDRGARVVVLDAAARCTGATVRNFGHIGTAMHVGAAAEAARRTNELWRRLAARAGFWLRPSGTLLVAAHDDELAVLQEAGLGAVLSAEAIASLAPVVHAVGGSLVEGDLQVDPREAGPAIARHLAAAGVEFRWRTTALAVEPGVLHTSRGPIEAGAIVVAVNADVDRLFPDLAEEHGVQRCALDMLLADGVGLEVPLLTASSMLRYSAFATMPSAAEVRARLAAEEPGLFERDVNQMYTERPDGTLIVGDTHHVAATVEPFQDEGAFALLERLGARMFGGPLQVRQRWQGVYARAPQDVLRASPCEGVRVVSVTTGIGMTIGLGLAESVVDELLGCA